jgi:hypothetical protein
MIQFDHVSDSFCVKDGDKWLYFDSVSKAKDAVREIKLRRAAEEERAKIVAFLNCCGGELANKYADWIEAGEHLK